MPRYAVILVPNLSRTVQITLLFLFSFSVSGGDVRLTACRSCMGGVLTAAPHQLLTAVTKPAGCCFKW